MPHVIAEPCIGTKDTACVDVCPVDCIHPSKDEGNHGDFEMLYIDPDTCIDCGLCIDECPVQAIFPEEDLPDEWKKYIKINEDWYQEHGD
tara:strand:+ start:239 stop:508 length:270 start_codon:yes stop_codon:yes gene_type:complete